jgi:isopentenyldiphosphate isomerase
MELWDILDEHGNKTDKTIERGGRPMAQGEYFLIVDVWIMNHKGEFLISKRTPATEPEPDKWQPTCGCAVAGDDSISAAQREVKEELGIILNRNNGEMIKRLMLWDKAIIDVWLFRQEVDISEVVLQPKETDDVRWATIASIKELIENDKFLSSQRLPYIDELFQRRNLS